MASVTTQITENLFTFQIPLPNNPLKWLNCYVIKDTSGRNLLIDTGFRCKPCQDALFAGIRELSLDLEQTDVLLTHLHSDHSGNADVLQKLGCRILMSEKDYDVIRHGGWTDTETLFHRAGMTAEILKNVQARNPAVLYAPERFSAEIVEDGDVLSYGGYRLECLEVPGHSPGNLCLYCRDRRIMFTGDHVLFDITPNITAWGGVPDILFHYLENLDRVANYDVELALPAHRSTGNIPMCTRIEQIKAHHAARLAEIRQAVQEQPGKTAYEIAGSITWKIRAKNWDDFPIGQKWFAVGETVAHLDYLVNRNKLTVQQGSDGMDRYTV